MDIRSEIVARRRERIRTEGPALGCDVPASRTVPLSSFPSPPGIICEVKRKSPSRGEISEEVDISELVRRYVSGGARSVSVLTEEDHFHGSLDDLVTLKRANPDVSFLRKDFLLNIDDVETSYLAGADAVLLIASILDIETLERLYGKALALGMTPLVEVHDKSDVDSIRSLRPVCVGCNARNLESFAVDPLSPLSLSDAIDWPCTKVFESGIWHREDAALVGASRFDAMLVGESVVRDPSIVPTLISAMKGAGMRNAGTRDKRGDFWSEIAMRLLRNASREQGAPRRPLVKICGLTRTEDVFAVNELGVDIAGFVFADSPRRADPDFVAGLADLSDLEGIIKVGVVVACGAGDDTGTDPRLPREVVELLTTGALDAIQFHGDEKPEDCFDLAFPYYKALRIRRIDDLDRAKTYRSPRVLLDAFSNVARGGTGTNIDDRIVESAAARGGLWLAGGIAPDNIRAIVERHGPELVDASSGLEAEPGIKDHALLRKFMCETEAAAGISGGNA